MTSTVISEMSQNGSWTPLYWFIDEVMFTAHTQTLFSLRVMEKYSGMGRAVLLLSGLGRSGNRTMKDKAVSARSVPPAAFVLYLALESGSDRRFFWLPLKSTSGPLDEQQRE